MEVERGSWCHFYFFIGKRAQGFKLYVSVAQGKYS
jgi:hypothetical protein